MLADLEFHYLCLLARRSSPLLHLFLSPLQSLPTPSHSLHHPKLARHEVLHDSSCPCFSRPWNSLAYSEYPVSTLQLHHCLLLNARQAWRDVLPLVYASSTSSSLRCSYRRLPIARAAVNILEWRNSPLLRYHYPW